MFKNRQQYINYLSSLLLILLLPYSIKAQSENKNPFCKLALHFDYGVNSTYGSSTINIEYEIKAFNKSYFHIYSRIGFGPMLELWGAERVGIMLGGTILSGRGKHHLEISGGPALTFKLSRYNPEYGYKTLFDIGYRYQNLEKGFIFRVKAGLLGIGIGIGYAF